MVVQLGAIYFRNSEYKSGYIVYFKDITLLFATDAE